MFQMSKYNNKTMLFNAAEELIPMLHMPLSLHLKTLELSESTETEKVKYTLTKYDHYYKLKREILNTEIANEVILRQQYI